MIYGIKGLVISKKFLNTNLFLIKTFLITKFDCIMLEFLISKTIALNALMMKTLLFLLFIGCSNALTLPKIFKDGMVLQAAPTDAVIWGFLDGNTNPVEVSGTCSMKGQKSEIFKTYIPKEVMIL